MKFATIGHLDYKKRLGQIPKGWIQGNLIVSPELDVNGTKGYILALKNTAQQMMSLPRDIIRQEILESVLFAQNELDVNIIQLGALTTSVTSGGLWISEQKEYAGFVNHGDSYTAAVTYQAVKKAISLQGKNPSELTLAVVVISLVTPLTVI